MEFLATKTITKSMAREFCRDVLGKRDYAFYDNAKDIAKELKTDIDKTCKFVSAAIEYGFVDYISFQITFDRNYI